MDVGIVTSLLIVRELESSRNRISTEQQDHPGLRRYALHRTELSGKVDTRSSEPMLESASDEHSYDVDSTLAEIKARVIRVV
jgi:hypothetical protein